MRPPLFCVAGTFLARQGEMCDSEQEDEEYTQVVEKGTLLTSSRLKCTWKNAFFLAMILCTLLYSEMFFQEILFANSAKLTKQSKYCNVNLIQTEKNSFTQSIYGIYTFYSYIILKIKCWLDQSTTVSTFTKQ